MPAKASVIPTKLPDTAIACWMSRTTATGIRLKPPTLRLVGSKVIQPAPGTKTSAHAWVIPHHSIRGFADRDCRDSQRRYARRTQGCAPRPQRAPRNPDTIPSRDPESGLETEALVIPALIADPAGDASTQVFLSRQHVSRLAKDKCPRPIAQPPHRSGYCCLVKAPRSVHSSSGCRNG